MKKKILFLLTATIIVSLSACKSNAGENVFEFENDTSNLESASANEGLENEQAELGTLESSITETEENTGATQVNETKEEQEEEGFTTATDPIIVPDPGTQSEFVVEVTAENFLSIFEFVAIDQYNTWGEYSYKLGGFSSLLYEQGWAIGTLEDFAVEYAVFDYAKVTSLGVTASKTHFPTEKDTEIGLRIHRAKGTLTCYPIESVEDTYYEYEDYQFIKRILPDGSEVWIETDKEGIMVY